MANSNELKRLGERFPNKNVGCGNPNTKILVVTQREGNEEVDFEYLKELLRNLPDIEDKNVDVLKHCYYLVYDEELLKDSFFDKFQVILYSFIDGNHLNKHDPAKLFGMIWMNECTVEDGATQRLFVAHSKAEDNKPERLMFCTYPFEKVSYAIQKCTKLLLNWFLLSPKEDF
ncbi:MAG: hypothetical protein J5932_00045 [Prevotella sp.]|nr:hypothetical protein [Prevotella sp.]